LNPVSGFYFPLFSMVFPWGISIRVAICGKEWNQNCSFSSSIYLQIFPFDQLESIVGDIGKPGGSLIGDGNSQVRHMIVLHDETFLNER